MNALRALRVIVGRVAAIGRSDRADEDLREELESLAAIEREERLASGDDPGEVRARVLARAGSVTAVQQAVRQQRTLAWLDAVMRDARIGVRTLWRHPLFALVAIVSLGLGIGANTAIFSLIDRLTLRALPVYAPERLAVLSEGTLESRAWTHATWAHLRTYDSLVDGAAAWSGAGPRSVTVDEVTLRSAVTMVSGEYFEVLGVPAAIGRVLELADDSLDAVATAPAAVISHRYWQSRFGGAPGVLGETLLIDRRPFTIVGVTPAGFDGIQVGSTFDVAVPVAAESILHHGTSRLEDTQTWWLQILLRLKPGQSAEAASVVLRTVQPMVRDATRPPTTPVDEHLATPFAVTPIARGLSPLRGTYATPLRVLMGAVAMILLIACANLAGLLLARTQSRRAEMAVRRSLGASRGRIVSQMLVESAVLASLGAGLGLVIARWGTGLVLRQIQTPTAPMPIALDVDVDGRMIGFALTITAATALLVGIWPALHAMRVTPGDGLRDQPRTTANRAQPGAALWMIGTQIALSFVLLAGAGLLVQSLGALLSNVGHLDVDRVAIARVSITPGAMTAQDEAVLMNRLEETAQAMPGVATVAVSTLTPAQPAVSLTGIEAVGGVPVAGGRRDRMVFINAVGPQYFATYGTPVVAGRAFVEGDQLAGTSVVIVNRAFVDRYVGGAVPPLGVVIGRLATGPGPAPAGLRIVGVVDNATISPHLEAPAPILYVPRRAPAPGDARVPGSRQISIRTAGGDARLLLKPLADRLARVSPFAAIETYTLDAQVRGLLTRDRLLAKLTSALAGLALLLTSIGLYGVVAYATAQRRREIGVRSALGATPGAIVRLVTSRTAVVILLGLGVGLGLTLWAGRFIDTLLFRLAPGDLRTMGATAAVLLATGTAAALIPAWRAAALPPATSLRE